MFTDITGKKRLKAGLHTHTTITDGHKSPEEVLKLYADAGYDILAITDHWKYYAPGQFENMTIVSGCEYNMGVFNPKYATTEFFHIVGLGMQREPDLDVDEPKENPTFQTDINAYARHIVSRIREAGGVAVLAHPAWSLNTPEQIIAAGDFDALEIYNSVSECGMSDRPDSGLLVDMLATQDTAYPLLATDDAHYYNGDHFKGMIMLEADAVQELGFNGAVRAGRFYATQGPEVHIERISDTEIRLLCSPAVKIAFHSNLVWTTGRIFRGDNLTEAIYTIKHNYHEKFVRAEVTDAQGLKAWSNIIRV